MFCFIRGQKIQTSIERMFRIWKERKVYSNAFLKELELLIEPVRKTQVNEALPDFKVRHNYFVVEGARTCDSQTHGTAAVVARCSLRICKV